MLVSDYFEYHRLAAYLARHTKQRVGIAMGVSRGLRCHRSRAHVRFTRNRPAIAAQGYDLSLNRSNEVVHAAVEHRSAHDILAELAALEAEIEQGMTELRGMLK